MTTVVDQIVRLRCDTLRRYPEYDVDTPAARHALAVAADLAFADDATPVSARLDAFSREDPLLGRVGGLALCLASEIQRRGIGKLLWRAWSSAACA